MRRLTRHGLLLGALLLLWPTLVAAQAPVQLFGRDEDTGQLRPIAVDTDGQLVVSGVIGGGGGGTEYDEGEEAITPAGTLSMWWDSDNTVHAASSAFPFPVEIVAGSIGGTFTEGSPFASNSTGIHPLYRACGAAPSIGAGVAEGDRAVPCMSTNGAIYVTFAAPDGSVPTFAVDATHGAAVVDSGPHPMIAAVAHGANPTAVAAGQAARALGNRAGIQWVIGGHPNAISHEAQIQDADGAQTNAALVTVSAGTKIVVTQAYAVCDEATTAGTQIVLGLAAATLPARAHTGVAGIVLAGDGHAAGGGISRGDGSGVLAIGADGEDLRLTTEDPVGGACSVGYTYYTIES